MPLNLDEARQYIEKRFRGSNGYVMFLTLRALRRIQVERNTGELILVGFRGIASVIRDTDGHMLLPMTVYRAVQDLVSEGMLEIAVSGRRGEYLQEANGYRFLPWISPMTHNNAHV
jgi:hypothetical protein